MSPVDAVAATVAPIVMGVLNVTPDSFSDGGQFLAADAAIARGLELARSGADVVDIGGESTRPGAVAVAPAEELERVRPVIAALASAGVAVSVDTLHASTARAAVEAGARYINDVSGGLFDADMLAVASEASRHRAVHFIIGHWRGIPDPAHLRSDYSDVVRDVCEALAERARAAIAAGVDAAHIVLDPGLGFDKTAEQGWQLLARLDQLRALGFPVLVGASRKRMLGETIESLAAHAPGTESTHPRDLATAVVTALAAQAGAWGVRVHDVVGSRQALAVHAAWESGLGTAGPLAPPAPSLTSSSVADAVAHADRITLIGLEVFAHHGVFDFEREQGQRFVIDAEVAVDLAPAAAGDALERTVHYGELAEAIAAAVASDPVDLIETVAERVAAVALGFSAVRSARITVHKPDAPITVPFVDVSVTVVRERSRNGEHA
ncbi:dihydropteroate synthase [Leucobacter musarum]|uniref:dihydropteroate synthase n=1 Tax=Leucobacter musarum TaxID=1930747 RepID=UPI000ACE1B3A|nr:dihydropteroate synthase [Leucobacter musarum]